MAYYGDNFTPLSQAAIPNNHAEHLHFLPEHGQ
jgi:hypothetical protein